MSTPPSRPPPPPPPKKAKPAPPPPAASAASATVAVASASAHAAAAAASSPAPAPAAVATRSRSRSPSSSRYSQPAAKVRRTVASSPSLERSPSHPDDHAHVIHPPKRSRSPSPRMAPRRDVRRVWNRRALENSGISDKLLAAFDAFTNQVPPIPTTTDLSRKIPIRNMRKWITDLETHEHDQLWDRFVTVLRTDTSVQDAWGDDWDHDLCRFILGVLVSDDQTKNRADKKQSRQAVNNAIKRELTCPIESGSSSRSKTFRDLFREKCSAGHVSVPVLVDTSSKTHRPPSIPHLPAGGPEPYAHAPSLVLTTTTPSHDQGPPHGEFAANFPIHFSKRKLLLSDRITPGMTARYREECATDEWGRTAWWQLGVDQAVSTLPFLLAKHSLFELRTLLLDFRWIRRTFQCADFAHGMRQEVSTLGYDLLLEMARRDIGRFPAVDIEGFRLIRNAIMVIIPILATDSIVDSKDENFVAHLATQLVGRLLNLKRRFPNIACLIQSIELHAPRPWLRPLNACFQEPRTDIKIAVPSNGTFTPHLIVLSEDGSLLAASGTRKVSKKTATSTKSLVSMTSGVSITSMSKSTSADKSDLRIGRNVSSIWLWDVESGKRVGVVDKIPSWVRCMALARDHSCVIAETIDGLFFWKLEKDKDEYRISSRVEATPRPKWVTSITPTVGNHGVLTTSRSDSDPVITLWNTETGRQMKSFSKVTSKATCTDVSMDGEYFASGHNNAFLHLWDLTSNDLEPVLSFKNEGNVAENGQQHAVLSKVNRTQDNHQLKTISVSFYEKGQESWLAAVSADEFIRVWGLPPRSITRGGNKSFVTSIRTAVLRCPYVRDVQWSDFGWFFSAGDDGIARMWSRTENGLWEQHAIGRKKRERDSDISAVLVSSGKQSSFVATYVTKSPYVTVWNMVGFVGPNSEVKRRKQLYRSYFSMVGDSVDARDIQHLTALEKTTRRGGESRMVVNGHGGESVNGMAGYGFGDNLRLIREELQKKFNKLDIKNATKLVDDMHPRLIMKPEEEGRPLEVCFEQPVIYGVSGTFKTAETGVSGSSGMKGEGGGAEIGGNGNSSGDGATGGKEMGKGRRGMVAALQDGAIGIFELEEAEGRSGKLKEESGVAGGGKGGAKGKEEKESKDKGKGVKMAGGASGTEMEVVVVDGDVGESG